MDQVSRRCGLYPKARTCLGRAIAEIRQSRVGVARDEWFRFPGFQYEQVARNGADIGSVGVNTDRRAIAQGIIDPVYVADLR